MRIKAAVLREIGADRPYAGSRPISIEEVTLDPPGPGEVLVRITGGGVCHSDLSVLNGARPRPLPLLLGHEGAGEVVETGTGVRDLKPGDPTVFQFSASCGRCARCLSGRPQLCEANAIARAKGELMGGGKRIRDRDGKPVNHHSGVSCFAEYAVLDRGSVVPITQDIPMDQAAIFGCAVMTGVGAVLNTARIRPGDKVAVVGLGGVGLSGLLGARIGNAGTLIAIDIADDKLGLARQLGATHTVNAGEADHVEQVMDITGDGVDYAFELAGSVAALATCHRILRPGGEVVIAGLAPVGAEYTLRPADMVNTEHAIRGSYMGGCVPVRDIPRFIDFFLDGRLPVDRLISRNIGFGELNDSFDRLSDGAAIRQILVPHAA